MVKSAKKSKKEIIRMAIIIMFIMIAYIPALFFRGYLYISNIIYIGLFTVWGISVSHRIIQRQAKIHLCSIAALMVLWLASRTVKWLLVKNTDITRYLWYAYYIPLLLIPVLSFLVALSMGKPEHYKLPKSTGFLMIPAIILLMMVFTNDYHQLVFKFPQIPAGPFIGKYHYSDRDYSYNIGYFLIVLWSFLIVFITMSLMNSKCRIPRSRKIVWQPLIPLAILIVYSILYVTNWQPLRLFARDMTFVYCLLITLIWENAIGAGLIQSNSRYIELFRAATIGAQIIDEKGNVLLASDGAASVDKELLFKVQAEPIFIADGIRLSSAALNDGHVVWHENLLELAKLLEELQDINEHLQGKNTTLQEEYATRRQRHLLTEQNRIYNKMQNQTRGQIHLLTELVDQLETKKGAGEEKNILAKIALVSAYIKRRNNLILLSEDNNAIPAAELEYCINESIRNLILFDISGDYYFAVKGTLPFYDMMIRVSKDTINSINNFMYLENLTQIQFYRLLW